MAMAMAAVVVTVVAAVAVGTAARHEGNYNTAESYQDYCICKAEIGNVNEHKKARNRLRKDKTASQSLAPPPGSTGNSQSDYTGGVWAALHKINDMLLETVENATRGKLSGVTHPMLVSGGRSSSNVEGMPLSQELLIFMVGGITYEESTKINEFNQANLGKIRIILGGSTIHNSTSYLEELKLMISR